MSASTRPPEAIVADSSRAVAASGATASNEASARRVSVATRTGSSAPVAGAETPTARTPAVVSARDEDRERVPEPGDERVPASDASELAVELTDPGERGLLLAVHDELRRTPEELDELGGQRSARDGLASSDCPREDRREPRDGDAGDEQADSEHHGGDGKEDCGDRDAGRADHERDDRRPEPAHVEPLERVDVADHAREEIAPPVALELPGGERLDPLVDARPDPAEAAQREVVRGEAVGVARDRPAEAEEADDHDRDGQREDRRLLCGARDQVPGGREEGDTEADRQRREEQREGDPSTSAAGRA